MASIFRESTVNILLCTHYYYLFNCGYNRESYEDAYIILELASEPLVTGVEMRTRSDLKTKCTRVETARISCCYKYTRGQLLQPRVSLFGNEIFFSGTVAKTLKLLARFIIFF